MPVRYRGELSRRQAAVSYGKIVLQGEFCRCRCAFVHHGLYTNNRSGVLNGLSIETTPTQPAKRPLA